MEAEKSCDLTSTSKRSRKAGSVVTFQTQRPENWGGVGDAGWAGAGEQAVENVISPSLSLKAQEPGAPMSMGRKDGCPNSSRE